MALRKEEKKIAQLLNTHCRLVVRRAGPHMGRALGPEASANARGGRAGELTRAATDPLAAAADREAAAARAVVTAVLLAHTGVPAERKAWPECR